MARNPTWSRDELILALDLYLRHRERLPDSAVRHDHRARSARLRQSGILDRRRGGRGEACRRARLHLGAPLAPDWFESVGVNASAVERRAATLTTRRSVKKEWQAARLVKAMTCIDLTTLSGDDTPGRVRRLCAKARRPLSDELIEALDLAEMGLTVAAVCVYPTMVGPAVKALEGSAIPVASVTIGFPAGIPGSSIGRIRRLRLQREKTVSYATQLSRARD